MANDISKAIVANPIKNGTSVVGCKVTGFDSHDLLNTYVSNKPTITDIQDKYDNRFSNGLLVQLVGTSGVIGV